MNFFIIQISYSKVREIENEIFNLLNGIWQLVVIWPSMTIMKFYERIWNCVSWWWHWRVVVALLSWVCLYWRCWADLSDILLWWCCWVKSCLDVAGEQFWALTTFVVALLSWIVPSCRCRADLSAIDLFGGATELNVILALGNFFWFWKILWKLFSHAILFVCSFFCF